MITPARLAAWTPLVQAALRIMTALLYLEHSLIKLIGFPPGAPPGQMPITSFLGVAGLIELVTSVLVGLGLFTRCAAFVASGQMAVAYFLVHAPNGFFPAVNMGEGAILYCFIFLFLSAAGPGAFALDNLRNKTAA
jgi:putative oxidoreductase